MRRTHTLVIGGGQAGLAMSRCLSDLGIDHVVLERGRVAERWRTQRWDSLSTLTPAWQSRLPGLAYQGHDPGGFLRAAEVIDLLERYAVSSRAPLETGTTVRALARADSGFRIETSRGRVHAENVVIATGHCDVPRVPAFATALPPRIAQVTSAAYRRPGDLPAGGVLVVGASASGLQIAEEVHASGRPVTLAVGTHARLPRRYRGRDIMEWLDATGALDEAPSARAAAPPWLGRPSAQLVGRARRPLDLGTLAADGVRVAGRLLSLDRSRASFADDLPRSIGAAEAKLTRLLARIDAFVEATRIEHLVAGPEAPKPVVVPRSPTRLDLRSEDIRSVIWAVGFDRRYPWLEIPILDDRGEILHSGGVTPVPGLYVLGLQYLRRRSSSFLDGVGKDAAELAAHIHRRGRSPERVAA